MIRSAQLGLLLAAASLWGASRMTWVEVTSFDGLGRPKTVALSGATWSTALVPLAVLLLAAAVAALAVRGWPLRLLAVLIAAASAGMAYLAISLWVVEDVAVRASNLAEAPVADIVGTQRHYGGAVITLVAAAVTLAAAVLFMRPAAVEGSASRYSRRTSDAVEGSEGEVSERAMWDALDEGRDPTNPDNKGR
ncbi:TIGR02234 family membrane protein [Mycobacterium sp. IDR2000157661]|uniref:TIGR02234 family membrane protein n=1 Tax=Mycobacterium sp. IDR2000157661 TaxID=2867005 RepID=UPI001EEC5B8F|nr:TIGR02234 family membrane protein [Mycobacterium sp. IDR2000157661]ULE32643.1 TIGR02234 family membrane protein [Mycobacterium sp. IDR2000157661]